MIPSFFSMTDLRDSWRDSRRDSHPEDREYTHFSHVHQSWSRVDCQFLSKPLHQRLENATIHYLVISDHTPISVIFSDTHPLCMAITRLTYVSSYKKKMNISVNEASTRLLLPTRLSNLILLQKRRTLGGG